MLNCTTEKYDKLYARWLESPGTLLDLGGYDPKADSLLDLCGGTGAVSLEALRRGGDKNKVCLLDLNPRCPDSRVWQITGNVNMEQRWADSYDLTLVVCRQSMGYLDLFCVGYVVAQMLGIGGRFVFNTFEEPRWKLEPYSYQGHWFLEAAWSLGTHVFHVQAAPGVGLDLTHFRYWTEEDVREAMDFWFTIKLVQEGHSLRWLCTRK